MNRTTRCYTTCSPPATASSSTLPGSSIPAARSAPPRAVADEVAYEGNGLGHVVAVDVHKGADRWTFKLASGAAITGSPAVDPSRGLVFAGAADGTLDAVTASKGTLSWAATVGGKVNAPVFASGVVYVTTS